MADEDNKDLERGHDEERQARPVIVLKRARHGIPAALPEIDVLHALRNSGPREAALENAKERHCMGRPNQSEREERLGRTDTKVKNLRNGNYICSLIGCTGECSMHTTCLEQFPSNYVNVTGLCYCCHLDTDASFIN